MRSRAFALGFFLAAAPAIAAPPTRDACLAASKEAQVSRLNGHLRAAREGFVVCSDEACPKAVRQDCNQWLDEVDRAIPTVVLGARDAEGKDLLNVRVSMDGSPVVERLDGKPIAVDVGAHTFRFEVAGFDPREENVLVREGEKDRVVTVTFAAAKPAEPTLDRRATQTPGVEHTTSSSGHGPTVFTWIVGGVGVATLGAAGIIGLVALGQRSSLYDSCGRAVQCKQSDVDPVYLMYDVTYAGVAIGSALVATSVVLFFATRSSAKEHSRATILPTLGGVVGRF
jgi:hypothetical protein